MRTAAARAPIRSVCRVYVGERGPLSKRLITESANGIAAEPFSDAFGRPS